MIRSFSLSDKKVLGFIISLALPVASHLIAGPATGATIHFQAELAPSDATLQTFALPGMFVETQLKAPLPSFTASGGDTVEVEVNIADGYALRFYQRPDAWDNLTQAQVRTLATGHGAAYLQWNSGFPVDVIDPVNLPSPIVSSSTRVDLQINPNDGADPITGHYPAKGFMASFRFEPSSIAPGDDYYQITGFRYTVTIPVTQAHPNSGRTYVMGTRLLDQNSLRLSAFSEGTADPNPIMEFVPFESTQAIPGPLAAVAGLGALTVLAGRRRAVA